MGFDTVKPTALMKKLLSYMGDNYTVLDFFSGTATTADACLQLNASTQGKRKFIMVQIDEKCKVGTDAYSAGYSNICEIGKERIRRAAKKQQQKIQVQVLILVSACSSWIPAI